MALDGFNDIFHKVRLYNDEIKTSSLPKEEGSVPKTESVVYFSLVKNTRGYIEKLVHQINGCYENAWYDACAVMIRRLIETLIIEVYEAFNISQKIKNDKDDFLYLSDLIIAIENEPSWNLGRNAKKSLKSLKDIGDKSAHSRRFNAHRQDVDKIIEDLRVVVQELIYLAKLK